MQRIPPPSRSATPATEPTRYACGCTKRETRQRRAFLRLVIKLASSTGTRTICPVCKVWSDTPPVVPAEVTP